MNLDFQQLIDFWFSPRVEKLWFNSTPEFDQELKQKYEKLYLDARNDKLQHWTEEPLGALGLVILFDQIPLNIYRKTAQSFETEARAREIAHQAIKNGWDKDFNNTQKTFLYMPFMHSENLQDQDLSVELFEKAGMNHNLSYAKHHRNIVVKFGRFPHRNEALQRQSTALELEYLASDKAFKG